MYIEYRIYRADPGPCGCVWLWWDKHIRCTVMWPWLNNNPVNTIRCPNAGSIMGRRRRRAYARSLVKASWGVLCTVFDPLATQRPTKKLCGERKTVSEQLWRPCWIFPNPKKPFIESGYILRESNEIIGDFDPTKRNQAYNYGWLRHSNFIRVVSQLQPP